MTDIRDTPPPLTKEQMLPYIKRCADYYGYKDKSLDLTAGAGFWALARAIEAAHGITEPKPQDKEPGA